MAYTLQELSDFEDIRTVKHKYFRCIDTANTTELRTLFTDDVTVEFRGGDYKVKFQGLEQYVVFVANSFHSDCAGMHHGHMPEIKLDGDKAEATWYLEDIFINLMDNTKTIGSAIYYDKMIRTKDGWKIYDTQYDRIMEVVRPFKDDEKITENYLSKHGLKKSERVDISHLITWF
jgi:hypothetical protein